MVCVRCNKRTAVVFVQRTENNQPKQEGYCMTCAREIGIKQVDDFMKQFGVNEEDMAAMEDRMNSMMGEMGENGMAGMFPVLSEDGEESPMFMPENSDMEGEDDPSENQEDDFIAGGSATFPFGFGSKREKNEEKGKKAPPKKLKYLPNYCENLTAKAKAGKLDNIVGRDEEIYRTIQILARRQKNNPCLIGEAGVGKTAIAEGIAQRIASENVPAILRGKQLYLLDMTALVAGTQFRGQFEQRVKGLIDEVKKVGNVILFIDEIHSITGAGDSEGAMSAGNILKPALSRGEIQVIGATTFAEYRKYIEKDQALERRFQPVKIGEPSISDAIAVIQGIKKYYEKHHNVNVSDSIAASIVSLSERYISDRFLPDKAIDLLDEACACCNLRHPEISELIEQRKKVEVLEAQEREEEQAEAIDYEKLAEVKTELAKCRATLPAWEEKAKDIQVEMEDVAKVIELWTGIPAVRVKTSEFAKLLGLESSLKARIIGQDEAVEAVSRAMKRARADLSGKRRPASFIFAGPTGVGKTELVKQLGEQLFDSPEPIIRIDMSEYMEKHAVSRLIGAPPGYVGHDDAGQLTEKVRRRPYSVVLFDEIEKAHPDVLNILLQILDEGRITDSQGRTVNFTNTVICMTTNAGSGERTGETGFGKTAAQMNEGKIMKALQELLRPEFLGRVDEVIAFKPLDSENLAKIAAILLDEYKQPLAEKGVELLYTEAACKELVEQCNGAKYGARDLSRVIRKQVEDPLAQRFVEGALSAIVTLDVQDDTLVLL